MSTIHSFSRNAKYLQVEFPNIESPRKAFQQLAKTRPTYMKALTAMMQSDIEKGAVHHEAMDDREEESTGLREPNIGERSTAHVAEPNAIPTEIREETAEQTPHLPFSVKEHVSLLENHPKIKEMSSDEESILALVSELYQRNIIQVRNELIKHEIIRVAVQWPSDTPKMETLRTLYEPLFQKSEKSDQARIELERLAKALKIQREWEKHKRLQLDTDFLVGSQKRRGYLMTLIERMKRLKPVHDFLAIWAISRSKSSSSPYAGFGHESRSLGGRLGVIGAVLECVEHHDPSGRSGQTMSALGQDFYPAYSRLLSSVISREKVLADKRRTWDAFLSRLYMALFGGWALTAPMLIMTLHQSKITSLVTTSVFVIAVAVALAWFMKDAQAKDIIGATAAYAAVLVVFVGTGTSTN
ncbi:hypothetical protein DL95DRAFT_507848 [Leptodontidium sp. 2 PMI_412]|nr:hypothetical protein DL95DRAFT_507848 [Leptodontidium sp. 2 PMI_412]